MSGFIEQTVRENFMALGHSFCRSLLTHKIVLVVQSCSIDPNTVVILIIYSFFGVSPMVGAYGKQYLSGHVYLGLMLNLRKYA
jgi:hypothetical protein